MKQSIIFWLEQIWNALVSIASVQKNQADWDETDETAASYIKNKPTIPTVIDPMIVEGTVDTGAFTPGEEQPTFAEALAKVAEGGVVYLKYTDSDVDIHEAVLVASESSIVTKNLTWTAPVGE